MNYYASDRSHEKATFLKKLVFVLTLSLLNILPVSTFTAPARATTSIGTASDVTIAVSETATVLNNTLAIADSLTISGFANNVRIVASVDTGTVQITTATGLSTVVGYDNSSSLTTAGDEIAFEGSVVDAQAALNSLKYTANNVTGTGTISISVSYVGSGTVSYNSDNGHYYIMYRYAPEISWNAAYDTTTAGIIFNGLSGYLATSTTETETTFIKNKVGSAEAWLGGYETVTTGSGVWKWVPNAPASEAGKVFFYDIDNYPATGCANGLVGTCSGGTGVAGETITAMYNNWNAGEPNNDSGAGGGLPGYGDALQVIAGGSGKWNDLWANGTTKLEYYLVEFGGKGETPTYPARTRNVLVNYTKPAASGSSSASSGGFCESTSIATIAPLGGPSSGGTQVTVTGRGLTSSVYFGGKLATTLLSSSNQVVVRTPSGTAGTAEVQVVGCGNIAKSSFVYDPVPAVASVSPTTVSTRGGTVVLSGSYLAGGKISAGIESISVSANTDASLTASLPASLVGEKTYTVTTSFGSTTFKVTFVAPPILAASISSGYIAQGDAVNLSYAATGATSYSASGKLPQGLTLNTTTGALSGTATKEGIYNFSITATNAVGFDTKNFSLDIDRPTPKALTANLYFASKTTTLTTSNKSGLDRLIAKVKAVAPRNLSASITMTGGSGNSKTNLTTTRHEQIKRYLEASGIKVKSASSNSGSANKVEIAITWIRQ